MTMLFLAYLVTILGQLHFTRKHFLTVHISAEQLLPQSNQFNTTTSSEQLLLQSSYFLGALLFFFSKELLIFNNSYFLSSYFFKIATYFTSYFFKITIFLNSWLERNFYRPATSCEWVVIHDSLFFTTATFEEGKFVHHININKRASFSKQALLQSIKCFRTTTFPVRLLFKIGTLSKLLVFQKCCFCKQLFFSEKQQYEHLLFQESCLFRVTLFSKELLFHT